MRILFLTNNPITQPLIYWLRETPKEEIVIYADKLTKNILLEIVPEFVISYNYQYKIPREVIELLPDKIINLHAAYLPYNRGADPIFWSLMEQTPLGITIHLIDEGWDTGDILCQEKVAIIPSENNFRQVYKLVHKQMQKMFIHHWSNLKTGSMLKIPQRGAGTFHFKKELNIIRNRVLVNNWETKIGIAQIRYNSIRNRE